MVLIIFKPNFRLISHQSKVNVEQIGKIYYVHLLPVFNFIVELCSFTSCLLSGLKSNQVDLVTVANIHVYVRTCWSLGFKLIKGLGLVFVLLSSSSVSCSSSLLPLGFRAFLLCLPLLAQSLLYLKPCHQSLTLLKPSILCLAHVVRDTKRVS